MRYEIERLAHVHDQLLMLRKRVSSRFPEWAESDARLSWFSKTSHVVRSVMLALLFDSEFLATDELWGSLPGFADSPQERASSRGQFDIFVKTGLLGSVLATTESSMRPIVKSVFPGACDNGTAEFKSIYSCLLSRLELQAFEVSLDLARMIRNTLHTNGVFVEKVAKDRSFTYCNVTYEFRNGKPITFATWELILRLVGEVPGLLAAIAESPKVCAISGIEDPAHL